MGKSTTGRTCSGASRWLRNASRARPTRPALRLHSARRPRAADNEPSIRHSAYSEIHVEVEAEGCRAGFKTVRAGKRHAREGVVSHFPERTAQARGATGKMVARQVLRAVASDLAVVGSQIELGSGKRGLPERSFRTSQPQSALSVRSPSKPRTVQRPPMAN